MLNSPGPAGPPFTKRHSIVLVHGLSPEESRPWLEQALRCDADAQRAATLGECETLLGGPMPAVLVVDAGAFVPRMADRNDPVFGACSLVLLSERSASDPLLQAMDCEIVPPLATTVQSQAALLSAINEAHERLDERNRVRDYHAKCAALSEDERSVFDSVCAGRLNKQIASDMEVSVRTIEQRRRRVFQKMGVDSAVPLAAMRAAVETLEAQWKRVKRLTPPPPEAAKPPAPHIVASSHLVKPRDLSANS